MNISKSGLDLIKKHERFRSKPYLCPANVPTIGYGATYYPGGRRVKLSDKSVSEVQATAMLRDMLRRYEDAVNRYVQQSLTQSQFDALVSFAYNVGIGALQRSTLLRRINADPNDPDIARQFARWKYANGRILRGLEKRRNEEANLYFAGTYA